MSHSLKLAVLFFSIFIISCGSDDSRSCVTCSSSQTINFEVCEESSGNASVNGENTGVSFATYIEDLESTGTNCGQ